MKLVSIKYSISVMTKDITENLLSDLNFFHLMVFS